jgi:hypothetical protein
LAPRAPEGRCETVEHVDIAGDAIGVRAGAVAIEVLVDVEDKISGATIEVFDIFESGQ